MWWRREHERRGALLRARVLLRRRWRSALALGVLAALGGGLVLALTMIARDTSSAVATYVARLDPPEGFAEYCPPGIDIQTPDVTACARYDQRTELAALRSDPDVVAAGRLASTPIRVRTGAEGWREGFAWVSMDGLSPYGDINVVAGRPADPAAADEVVVNESFLAEHGAQLGGVLDIATITWDEFDSGLSTVRRAGRNGRPHADCRGGAHGRRPHRRRREQRSSLSPMRWWRSDLGGSSGSVPCPSPDTGPVWQSTCSPVPT